MRDQGAAQRLDPRRQLAIIGLAGTVVPLVLVGTALASLREVNLAHAEADRIAAAQVDFLLADMAHDTMRGDVLELTLADDPAERARAARQLSSDVERFRSLMRRVDAAELPDDLSVVLQRVRPLQEEYADDVSAYGDLAVSTPDVARAMVPTLSAQFTDLVREQAVVTDAMSDRAAVLQRAALDAERGVRARVIASAVAAVVTMAGLAWLLQRLGAALAVLLKRERGVAELLQHSLLPDRLPEVPGVRLAARYVPGAVGTEVGGDWYDVIALPSGEVGLVMGDVVGHDLGAAANMGQLRNGLRACAAEGSDPGEVLERLNRLCIQQDLGSMATVVYAIFDPVLRTLRMASAGHYPPLHIAGDQRRYLESDPCPPIGAVREVRYPTTQHQLAPGSLLALYTDGLVERRDVDVDVGMKTLLELVPGPQEAGGLEGVCDTVLGGMLAGRPTDDDVALLVVAVGSALGDHLDFMLPAEGEQLAVLRRTLERWLVEAGATDQEVYEITVACSEATTNAIEHAYGPGRADVEVVCDVDDGEVTIVVRDWGQWREPRGRDRGRGLLFMRELMDDVDVRHGDRGTQVIMRRRLAARPAAPTTLSESR